ncbi:uncharacterized protein METZ01_LOCUS489949, partial [marine metagenome]
MGRNKNSTGRANRGSLKGRLILVSSLFVVFGISLIGRLFFLQVTQHENLVSKSEKQYQRTINIHYGRGSIFDRNMNELTANIEVESVYATPQKIINKKKTAKILASVLNLNQASVYKKINSKRHFIWLKRKAPPIEIARLRKNLPSGVNFISEHKRFFPKRELASGVIGFTGIDNQGLAGIEHQYDN